MQGDGQSLANGKAHEGYFQAHGDVNNTVPLRVHVLEKLLGGLFSKQEKC